MKEAEKVLVFIQFDSIRRAFTQALQDTDIKFQDGFTASTAAVKAFKKGKGGWRDGVRLE